MLPGKPVISLTDWDGAPWNRWTFQHVREMAPTAEIASGDGPIAELPLALQDIDAVSFSANGRCRTIAQFLEESFTDGFLVLSRGQVVAERYMNGMTPRSHHLAMSVSKSITATVAGILVGRGLLATQAPVTDYLPELAATAYRGARVQHVLDMTTGVLFDESYTTPGSHMQKLDMASGWKPHTRPDWPLTIWQLILELTELSRPHGALFEYRSIETDVLAFMMERVTGKHLATLISEELWQPMGAERDAYITVDRAGYGLADGGFNATLRDYARFALLHLRRGKLNGRQIVPAGWLDEIHRGNHEIFPGDYRIALPTGAYHNQFWLEAPESNVYMARGICGQYIYIDPDADFAVVKLSTWPEFINSERSIEALAAFRALREHLAKI
jgi:CubicO group peptidase (beta-lactamase class C family)